MALAVRAVVGDGEELAADVEHADAVLAHRDNTPLTGRELVYPAHEVVAAAGAHHHLQGIPLSQ